MWHTKCPQEIKVWLLRFKSSSDLLSDDVQREEQHFCKHLDFLQTPPSTKTQFQVVGVVTSLLPLWILDDFVLSLNGWLYFLLHWQWGKVSVKPLTEPHTDTKVKQIAFSMWSFPFDFFRFCADGVERRSGQRPENFVKCQAGANVSYYWILPVFAVICDIFHIVEQPLQHLGALASSNLS